MQSKPKLDYKSVTETEQRYRIYENMRSTLLQAQFLNEFLDKKIELQNENIKRHYMDRILQIDQMYSKCLELEISNATKYLIVKLQQLIDIEQPFIEAIWPKLDELIDYIMRVKSILKTSSARIYVGSNIGINLSRINQLIPITKTKLGQYIERNQEYFNKIDKDTQSINQIFDLMQKYCSGLLEVVLNIENNYDKYILSRIKREHQTSQQNISRLKMMILG